MRFKPLAFALVAVSISASLFAADVPTDKQKLGCFNSLCPVCEEGVSAAIPTFFYKPRPDAQYPDMSGDVGFCSGKCRVEFERHPTKYEFELYDQYDQRQQARRTPDKRSAETIP